ncbi:MAG: RrF2 family transcriptional regulator [Acidimicrobiales bacterium]
MRMSEGVEWAIHCVTVLALVPADATLSGARLAEFHGVPSAYLAKTLQALARAGIIESAAGRRGGYRLTRPAADISVLDIVLAAEGDAAAFRCSEIRRRGPSAVAARHYTDVCGIAAVMWRAEEAWRTELAASSVADVINHLARSITPESATKAAAWMQEVLT